MARGFIPGPFVFLAKTAKKLVLVLTKRQKIAIILHLKGNLWI